MGECVLLRAWCEDRRIRELLDDVLGKTNDDRARAAARGEVEGVADVLGGAGGVVKDHDALGRRTEPCAQVELLERLAVAVGDRDEADEEDHRGGVLVGGVDSDEGVRSTRTARHHAHTGNFGETAFGECHEAGATFLAAHDRLNRGVMEAVEHIEVALARNSVDALDALRFELLDEQVAAGEASLGRGFSGHVTPHG